MIFLLLGFFILYYSTRNYKRGFFLFLIYDIFLTTNISMVSISGIPLLSLEVFMLLCYAFLFFMRKKTESICPVDFPLKWPFIIIFCSYIISSLLSIAGFSLELSRLLKELLIQIGVVWLIWLFVEDVNDIRFLMKGFTLVFFLSCIYAFYEKTTFSNPIADYELSMVQDQSRAIDFTYDEASERGFRVKSFFEHSIGAGINWAMYIIMSLILYVINKIRLNNMWLVTITCLLCIPCILYTNSRGPVFFFIIGCMSFLTMKSKNMYYILFFAIVLIGIINTTLHEYGDVIRSLYSEEAQAKIGGSDFDMRMEQLMVAQDVVREQPLFGLGLKFYEIKSSYVTAGLLGMESIWFKTIAERGLLGVVSNIILIIYSCVVLPRKYHSHSIFFISVAYWLTATATSVPGMKIYFYYLIIFTCIKLSSVYQEEKEIKLNEIK